MRSSRKNTFQFDEDFEVTYEEEIPFQYKLEPETNKQNKKSLQFVDPNVDTGSSRDRRYYDLSVDNPDNGYDGYYDSSYRSSREEEPYGSHSRIPQKARVREDYDTSPDSAPLYSHYPAGRQKKRGQTPLAAPIQKGGRAVSRVSRTIMRNLSLVLILAIVVFLGYNFLRGSAPYGDIENAVTSRNYTQMLAAYFMIAAFFLLFELLSALWAMTKVRVYDEFGYYKEDVGRGLFSFIFIYLCSYAAFLTSAWIPEIHDILRGVKGALNVFGSMHNILFGLCAAGVISCLFRKYSLSL